MIIDNSGHKTACLWLDKDHSGGIKYDSLHLYLPHFGKDETKSGTKYSADWYCKNRATMQFFNKGDETRYWKPDGTRSLEDDEATVANQTLAGAPAPQEEEEPPAVGKNCTDSKPPTHQRNKKPHHKKPEHQQHQRKKRSAGMEAELVVSTDEAHTASELCGSETSHGPDFVSVAEKLFCDMGAKTLWPLCNDVVTTSCFHLESKTLRTSGAAMVKREAYAKVTNWE